MEKTSTAHIHALKPVIQIGKHGLSENVILEVKKHLKKRKLIKVKCLRYFLDTVPKDASNKQKVSDVASFLADQLGAKIIEVKGFTIVLEKNIKTENK
jgi:RNA-binding protein